MSALKGVFAVWYREFKVFVRERSRIVASIVNPLMWFLVIGGGIGSIVDVSGIDYRTFIFPGVLMQSILFSSIFFGVYIVWDRKIDFLKEVLVSPMSRTAIFMGKVLGGSTDTIIQVVILIVVGFVFSSVGFMPGLRFDVFSLFKASVYISAATVAAVSVGLILGSQMESPEGFQLVSSFVIFPMFFLSGAFFPVNTLPTWLAFLVYVNPMTYAVDGMRWAFIGVSAFNPWMDFAVVYFFAGLVFFVGAYAFKKMRV